MKNNYVIIIKLVTGISCLNVSNMYAQQLERNMLPI